LQGTQSLRYQVSLANANTIKVMMLHNSAQSNAGFREGTLVEKKQLVVEAACGSMLLKRGYDS